MVLSVGIERVWIIIAHWLINVKLTAKLKVPEIALRDPTVIREELRSLAFPFPCIRDFLCQRSARFIIITSLSDVAKPFRHEGNIKEDLSEKSLVNDLSLDDEMPPAVSLDRVRDEGRSLQSWMNSEQRDP